VLILGVVVTLTSFMINDLILPLGAIEFKKILQEITLQNPAVELSSFSIKQIQQGKQITLVTGEVTEELVLDPIILDKDSEGRRRIIVSDEAFFGKEQEEGVSLELRMADVKVLVPHDKIRGNYEFYSADLMSYNILMQEFSDQLGAPSPLEMTSRDLFSEIQMLKNELAEEMVEYNERLKKHRLELYGNYLEAMDLLKGGTKRQENLERYLSPAKEKIIIETNRLPENTRIGYYELEFFQKFSLPLGVMTFVIFCFPLGLFNSRSGWVINLIMAFSLALGYYFLLIFARDLARNQNWPPFWAVFLPNIIGLVSGGLLFLIKRRQ
jgi:lipopolysaccharide export system permease protein